MLFAAPLSAQCIPFHNVQNRIVANVTINGHGPYAFLLDTGSQYTMVDALLAKAYSLPDAGAAEVVGTGGGQTAGRFTKVSVGLAGQQSTARAVVYNFATTKGIGIRVYGILGMDFLSQHTITIDGLHSCLIVN